MELELGLGLPQYSSPYNSSCSCCNHRQGRNNKRTFSQAYQHSNNNNKPILLDDQLQQCPTTREKLPLMVSWGDKPNKEDEERETSNDSSTMSEVEENDHVVGWPPINSWRKKNLLLWRQQNNNNLQGGGDGRRIWNNQRGRRRSATSGGGGLNSLSNYLKVKMEGVAIGRKINLQLFDSYDTLKSALIDMFAKYHTWNVDNNRCYSLTYQDRDGDWMLAGDLPWKTFTETARRLEILKTPGG